MTATNSQIGQHMSDFSTTLQSFVAAVAGGIITTEIYGGDFATNVASGFIRSYIDYTSNELGGNLFDGDITEALELTMDFIPVVSNLKAVIEVSTGKTIFGGQDIAPEVLGLTAAAIFIGPAAKVAIRGAQFTKVTLKHSDDALDLLTSSSSVSGVVKGTGTVWDSVKATQSAIKGTSIPKSFELAVDGDKFWVHPNATKHMAEYLTRNGMSHGTATSSQAMLKSFHSAVTQAVLKGYKSDELIQVGRWEISFGSGKTGDALPVIKHALYK